MRATIEVPKTLNGYDLTVRRFHSACVWMLTGQLPRLFTSTDVGLPWERIWNRSPFLQTPIPETKHW